MPRSLHTRISILWTLPTWPIPPWQASRPTNAQTSRCNSITIAASAPLPSFAPSWQQQLPATFSTWAGSTSPTFPKNHTMTDDPKIATSDAGSIEMSL